MNIQTRRLLTNIYKSSKMGMHVIETFLQKFPNSELKDSMNTQYDEYDRISQTAKRCLETAGILPEDNGFLSKAALYNMVQINSASIPRLSEMMMSGILDFKKNLDDCVEANDDSKQLAQSFIETEETQIECLKLYL